VGAVRNGLMFGLVTQILVLASLGATEGLSGWGWVVGGTCGVVTSAVLARGLTSFGVDRLGPANCVTLVRAALAGGVSALTAESFSGSIPVAALVGIAAVELALDAVDGRIARRTSMATMFGGRFDEEVDAFLILVLSVYVARSLGVWVLTIGLARYAFGMAGWMLPWMRRPLPLRYWGKVVAATQGVVLTVVATNVLPRVLADALVVVALGLLAESFGRSVWWLMLQRPGPGTVSVLRPERSEVARTDLAG
jgi:phosphatidylglycerophosphate synthase